MCRLPFAAGIGHNDLAGLGRTLQAGAEVVMDCDPRRAPATELTHLTALIAAVASVGCMFQDQT